MDNALPPLLFRYKKYIDELLFATFSIITESDPNRTAKQLHLKNWCRAFLSLFIKENEEQNPCLSERIPFFLDVLSDEECWEETDTIHRVNLNRRIAAKKIVQSSSRSGIPNPLDYDQRYRVACWCCLEEDIFAFFDYFKQNSGIRTDDAAELNKLVGKKLSRGRRSEPLTIYWSHIAGGYASEIHLEGKHLLEYGLEFVFVAFVPYVEAVEFFCNKIRSLSENELSDKQKDEIIIQTAVRAAGTNAGEYPEVFEYCNRQLSFSMYPEFIKRENEKFESLGLLQQNICFDQFQKLFDCLDPTSVTKSRYYSALNCLVIPEYSENYTSEALKLFTHMWMKEGFDEHRSSVLDSEMKFGGELLVYLVKKKYMELVWALLDKASFYEMKIFMNSSKANYILSELHQGGDNYSLNKFLSYVNRDNENPSRLVVQNSLNNVSSCNYATKDSENQSISGMEVDTDWDTPLPKRQRIE